MSTCAIRYRLDAGGPAVFVVEASDGYHFYSHGQLGPIIPVERLPMLLTSRSPRWVQATGHVTITNRQAPRDIMANQQPVHVEHEVTAGMGALD